MVVFLHIFIKSEQADLAPRELEGMRGLAQEISALGYPDIEMLLELGEWSHVG